MPLRLPLPDLGAEPPLHYHKQWLASDAAALAGAAPVNGAGGGKEEEKGKNVGEGDKERKKGRVRTEDNFVVVGSGIRGCGEAVLVRGNVDGSERLRVVVTDCNGEGVIHRAVRHAAATMMKDTLSAFEQEASPQNDVVAEE